jgi:hypothetical protein
MHKTTLLVDDSKVRKAQEILGTRGIKDTIDRALDEVLASDARRRELQRLKSLRPADLEAMKRAWR